MYRFRRHWLSVILFILPLFVSACGADKVYKQSSVLFAPEPSSQPIGQPLQLHVFARYGDGSTTEVTANTSWTTSSAAIASVDTHGVLLCESMGIAQIAATANQATASTSVNCTGSRITITPDQRNLLVGQPLQLHATLSLPDGTTSDVTTSSTWTSTNAAVAGISSTGVLSCSNVGITQISATSHSLGSTISVTCAEQTLTISGSDVALYVSESTSLHAVAILPDGTSSDVTTSAVWSLAPLSGASINNSGLITCNAAGPLGITATLSSGAVGHASMTCLAGKLVIGGLAAPYSIHDPVQLHALATLGTGPSTDVTSSAIWSTSNAIVASVNSTGVLTCDAVGNTQVTATTKVGIATNIVTCTSPPLAITIAPGSITASVGQAIGLAATASYKDGSLVEISSQALWTSQGQIVSVSSAGVLRCMAVGSSIVTATFLGISNAVAANCVPPSMHTPSYFREASDEFVGPFPSWMNIKTRFGAVGDGIADDTAAIQRAFDSINTPGSNPVVWLPAGTYRITHELLLTHKQAFSVIGADKDTTTIKWDGPSNGTMLHTDGSTGYRILRLTWDGNKTADTAENLDSITPNGYYQGFIGITDEHIVGVQYGIRLPKAAEVTVDRVYFDHLPQTALSVEDWNTINIFVNDSLFDGCGTGLSNLVNAGLFIASNNVFRDSTVADMSIRNTGYFSARHNISLRPASFFRAEQYGANLAIITLQNNTILDPVNAPFYLGDMGPLMLIDNAVRFSNTKTPYLMSVYDLSAPADVFSIGNMYTSNAGVSTSAGLPLAGRLVSYDDTIVDAVQIPDVSVPSDVYNPPNLHRKVFEVNGFTGEAIQSAINLAAQSGTSRPVVHLADGVYRSTVPITIPPDSDLQLIGDDCTTTQIVYTGKAGVPIIQIKTSNVSVSNIRVASADPGNRADGIMLTLKDQPNTQVIVDDVQLQSDDNYSIRFDGVEHMTAELFSTYTQGNITGVNVLGGPFRAVKEGVLGVTNFYSGSLQSTATSTSFNVDAWGKFMIQDNWHDLDASGPRNVVLTGTGTITEQTGTVAMTSSTPFETNGFEGDISLIGLGFRGRVKLQPGHGPMNLLSLGIQYDGPSEEAEGTGNITVGEVVPSYYDRFGQLIPQRYSPDASWLRHMLAQTRSEYPIQRLPLTQGAHRVRLSRVETVNSDAGIRFVADQPASGLYYSIQMGALMLAGTQGGCLATQSLDAPGEMQWLFSPLGEGDVQIAPVGSTLVLTDTESSKGIDSPALQSADGGYGQRWLIRNNGDGRFTIVNRKTGLLLGSGAGGGCVVLQKAGGETSTNWTVVAR